RDRPPPRREKKKRPGRTDRASNRASTLYLRKTCVSVGSSDGLPPGGGGTGRYPGGIGLSIRLVALISRNVVGSIRVTVPAEVWNESWMSSPTSTARGVRLSTSVALRRKGGLQMPRTCVTNRMRRSFAPSVKKTYGTPEASNSSRGSVWS